MKNIAKNLKAKKKYGRHASWRGASGFEPDARLELAPLRLYSLLRVSRSTDWASRACVKHRLAVGWKIVCLSLYMSPAGQASEWRRGRGQQAKFSLLKLVWRRHKPTYSLVYELGLANQTTRLIYSKFPVWRSGVLMQTEGYECWNRIFQILE